MYFKLADPRQKRQQRQPKMRPQLLKQQQQQRQTRYRRWMKKKKSLRKHSRLRHHHYHHRPTKKWLLRCLTLVVGYCSPAGEPGYQLIQYWSRCCILMDSPRCRVPQHIDETGMNRSDTLNRLISMIRHLRQHRSGGPVS